MAVSDAFRAFEHAGWNKDSLALVYHRNLGEVTKGCIPDLLNAVHLKTGDRVLDVACGAGYIAAAAHDRGADTVGVDFSAARRPHLARRAAGKTWMQAALELESNLGLMDHLPMPIAKPKAFLAQVHPMRRTGAALQPSQ
jgi:2-polyprenyl-3-methyl-5-hydroxy-6-metoxy-1,4-benzoquinol methylase